MSQPVVPPTSMEREKRTILMRVLDVIERYGNRLPDPVTLFVLLSLIILVASHLAASAGISAVNPATQERIQAVSLLTKEGMVRLLTEMVQNFAQFPPLGLVLVAMLGVGLAEESGLIGAVMKQTVLAAPRRLVIPAIVFAGIMGNAAGDAAFIVLPPIAAMITASLGYSPLVGLVVAYASVAGGFCANLLVNMLDALVAGFTQKAAQMVDPTYLANPAMNYYFLVSSTVVLLGVAVWVTQRYTLPRFARAERPTEELTPLTAKEKRGLRWAAWATLGYGLLLAWGTLPQDGLLRNPETGSLLTDAPLMKGIVPLVMLLFFLPALFYGIGAGTIRSDRDVARMLGKAMATMGPYIVLAFVAAQMIAFFQWSNLGPILAIKGAEALKSIGFTGLPLLVSFVALSALINLILASSSAKWAILAPVFVPMFLFLGYDPALTQMAYRIGDSITNPITPMLPYFAILLSFARQYDPRVGMGTLIAALLPFTIFFSLAWVVLISVWYVLGWPLGPDGPLFRSS